MNDPGVLEYSCATNIGSRNTNQDNFLIDGDIPFLSSDRNFSGYGSLDSDGVRLFAVCDGIGGFGDSAEVSRSTVELLSHRWEESDEGEDLASRIISSLDEADAYAREVSARSGRSGGTTATVVALRGSECVLVNVGDSPAFILQKDGVLHELTFRHNMATYKRMAGVEPEESDERLLIYGVGAGESRPSRCAHIARGTLTAGDVLFLCSDGVTNAFSEEDLAYIVKNGATAEQIANKAGEMRQADNCTAVIVKYYG